MLDKELFSRAERVVFVVIAYGHSKWLVSWGGCRELTQVRGMKRLILMRYQHLHGGRDRKGISWDSNQVLRASAFNTVKGKKTFWDILTVRFERAWNEQDYWLTEKGKEYTKRSRPSAEISSLREF